jgi:hemerythrin-like metal-binding protein
MPFYVWKNAFSVGVEHLDEQHRIILDSMNRMYDSLGSGNASQEIDLTLVVLRDYANTHFDDEENLLVSIDYPELDRHKSMHRYFVSQLDEFKHCQGESGATLNSSLLLFLRDWLLNHIIQEDRKYRDYLAAHTPESAKPSA